MLPCQMLRLRGSLLNPFEPFPVCSAGADAANENRPPEGVDGAGGKAAAATTPVTVGLTEFATLMEVRVQGTDKAGRLLRASNHTAAVSRLTQAGYLSKAPNHEAIVSRLLKQLPSVDGVFRVIGSIACDTDAVEEDPAQPSAAESRCNRPSDPSASLFPAQPLQTGLQPQSRCSQGRACASRWPRVHVTPTTHSRIRRQQKFICEIS